ncbi:ICE2 family protein [Aspergillus novofumigatus IBT 16806]|uniref:ICE2-domain-containing protein n=1 Tax=Aspergillus novofumigatus (strain IBT 16806) TaxID=1392255 RepID=A0A2I1CA25_ASPN1|nr:ICE2-domain-containing protein [Aspergillus novofumigatus IBT 16806]PKX94472.1 ICE2-domain-containing protein [Aspergillus novofumigatus IBT 16806]
MWLFRILSSALFLTVTVSSIPLAFDVGGKTCGLAFSLSLATFYFIFSLLRLTTPERSWFRSSVIVLIRSTQWIIIPILLIWSLNRFSIDTDNTSSWVERTFSGKRAQDSSVQEWLFGPDGLIETVTIGNWYKLLTWSTPVFQLVEGFCSLLVIQAAGQITRWLVNRGGRSDSWMIALLVLSASVISSSVYFLWRVLQFPEISNVDAALIGVSITCAVILCAWGIGSGRGNPVESSLLFAYVVLCIYQIFTDYQPSYPVEQGSSPSQTGDLPPLPPIIMASYSTLMHALSSLPSIIHAGFNVITAVFSAVTPSVLISLAYRIFVLYASTRIIPAVRESGARALSQEASLDDTDAAGQFLGFLSYFSPSILIAVYTSLLMQHFATTSQAMGGSGQWWSIQGGGGGNLWRWVNLACTLALYAVELWLGENNDLDTGLAGHWKTD